MRYSSKFRENSLNRAESAFRVTNPTTDRTPQLALYSNPLDTRTETDRVRLFTPDGGLRYETTRFLRGGDPPGGESNAKPPLFEASQGRAPVPDALYPTACVQTEIAVKTTSRRAVTMETHVIGEENRYKRRILGLSFTIGLYDQIEQAPKSLDSDGNSL